MAWRKVANYGNSMRTICAMTQLPRRRRVEYVPAIRVISGCPLPSHLKECHCLRTPASRHRVVVSCRRYAQYILTQAPLETDPQSFSKFIWPPAASSSIRRVVSSSTLLANISLAEQYHTSNIILSYSRVDLIFSATGGTFETSSLAQPRWIRFA